MMDNINKIAEGSEIQDIIDKTPFNTYDLRDFMCQIAEKVNTFSDQKRIYWESVLFSELTIYSELKYLDVSELQQQNCLYIEKIKSFNRTEKKLKYLSIYMEFINSLLSKIYLWSQKLEYKKIISGDVFETLNKFLTDKEFCTALSKILLYLQKERTVLKNVHSNSLISTIKNNTPLLAPFYIKGDELGFEGLIDLVNKTASLIIDFLFVMKLNSEKRFNTFLAISTNQPHIDIFQAYQNLYKIPQTILNSIGSRIIHYYYNSFLKEDRKGVTEDFTYLCFNLNDKVNNILLEKGINFIGGVDNKRRNILYQSPYSIILNRSSVSKILQRNIQGSTIAGLDREFITGVKEKEEVILNKEDLNLSNWFYNEAENESNISFIIADEILKLSSGRREIDIKIAIKDDTFNDLVKLIKSVAKLTGWEGKQLHQNIFQNLFLIYVSSKNQWLKITDFVFLDELLGSKILHYRLFLEEEFAAITPFENESNSISNLPQLKFQLNRYTYLFGYTFLSKLLVEKITLEVNVEDFTDIEISNTKGNLDVSIPFSPFGLHPQKGDYFELKSSEVLSKNIKALSMHIDWFNLPELKNGLTEYYADYKNVDIKNESFEIGFSCFENNKWEEGKKVKMFNLNNALIENRIISNTSTYNNIEVSSCYHKEEISHKPFLKVTLLEPKEGFAHQLYPILQQEQFRNNISSFFPFFKKMRILKEPFSPIAEKVRIDYKAKSVILFNEQNIKNNTSFYHGLGTQLYPSELNFPPILPVLKKGIYVELGIDNVNKNDIISILLDIKSSSVEKMESSVRIDWEYLKQNKWEKIPSINVLIDETEALTKTGILQVKMPEDISLNSSLKRDNLVWIRGVLANVNSNISEITNIYNRAIKVKLVYNDTNQDYEFGKILPKKSIVKAEQKLSGIREIYQPLDSSGGNVMESNHLYYDRVAKTIKHRNRPILVSDYEDILLSQFKTLNQVVCIPVSNENKILTIVIVPRSKSQFPKATRSELNEVNQFLKEKVSRHINYRVISPIYEKLKVNISLSFKQELSEGFFIEEIQRSISNFINTLSFSEGNIKLGGKINISDILSYLKTKSYIDKIHNLTLIHHTYENQKHVLVDSGEDEFRGSFISSSKPWSVLISANHHEINITKEKHHNAGIGLLQIGEDLVVNEQ